MVTINNRDLEKYTGVIFEDNLKENKLQYFSVQPEASWTPDPKSGTSILYIESGLTAEQNNDVRIMTERGKLEKMKKSAVERATFENMLNIWARPI